MQELQLQIENSGKRLEHPTRMGTPHFLFRTPHLIRATPQKIKKATQKTAVLRWSHSLSISSLQHKKRESKDSRFLFYFTALPQNIHIKQAKTAPKALTPSMLFFSSLLRSFLMGVTQFVTHSA